MASVGTYLNFNGNTEEVFNFYKSVFGGEFVVLQRFKDAPQMGPVSEADMDKVMHVSMPIAGGHMLMGSDMLESMGHKHIAGNNFSISLNADSEAEADELFNGLSVDGNVTMALQKTFWGAYFGMWTDKFGIQWMINYDYPKPE